MIRIHQFKWKQLLNAKYIYYFKLINYKLHLISSFKFFLSKNFKSYTRCVWKVMGVVLKTIHFKQQNTWFPLQSNSLESNALSYSFLPYFYALLEGFLLDISQLCCYSSFDGLYTSKWVSWMIAFNLEKRKKVTWIKIR